MLSVPADELPRRVWDLIEAATDDCCVGSDQPGWSPFSLPDPMRTVLMVYKLQNMVDNENLDFFFDYDWTGNPPYTVFSEAFRRIGAIAVADCIDDAVGMFPSRSPHLDCELRRSFMASEKGKYGAHGSPIEKLGWRISSLGGETMQHLVDFIGRHFEYFPSARQIAEQAGGDEPPPSVSV